MVATCNLQVCLFPSRLGVKILIALIIISVLLLLIEMWVDRVAVVVVVVVANTNLRNLSDVNKSSCECSNSICEQQTFASQLIYAHFQLNEKRTKTTTTTKRLTLQTNKALKVKASRQRWTLERLIILAVICMQIAEQEVVCFVASTWLLLSSLARCGCLVCDSQRDDLKQSNNIQSSIQVSSLAFPTAWCVFAFVHQFGLLLRANFSSICIVCLAATNFVVCTHNNNNSYNRQSLLVSLINGLY